MDEISTCNMMSHDRQNKKNMLSALAIETKCAYVYAKTSAKSVTSVQSVNKAHKGTGWENMKI